MRFFTGLLVILFSQFAFANYSANLFEEGSKKQTKIYTFSNQITTEGDLEKIAVQYKDLEGKVVVEERATVKGSDLVKYEIDQNQTGHKGSLEVVDGKAIFTKIEDGKEKKSEEKLKSKIVVSANFQKFVKENWPAIQEGKTVEFRYGVWARRETIGFEIKKAKEEDGNWVLKMNPSSFIFAALVKPLYFVWKADGSQLLEMRGRVPVMKKDGNSWKDLDAEVVYQY